VESSVFFFIKYMFGSAFCNSYLSQKKNLIFHAILLLLSRMPYTDTPASSTIHTHTIASIPNAIHRHPSKLYNSHAYDCFYPECHTPTPQQALQFTHILLLLSQMPYTDTPASSTIHTHTIASIPNAIHRHPSKLYNSHVANVQSQHHSPQVVLLLAHGRP
jgi:hypothetical protein